MLHNVSLVPLKIIPDERGQVMHVLRNDVPHFEKFGETYISVIYPNIVKGWKLHMRSKSHMAVPIGRIKFVLYDMRDDSPTKGQYQDVFLGDNAYQLLIVPAGIAYAWKNLLPENAYVINCATEPHQPDEGKQIPLSNIPYAW